MFVDKLNNRFEARYPALAIIWSGKSRKSREELNENGIA
jgi:hypothetical protein